MIFFFVSFPFGELKWSGRRGKEKKEIKSMGEMGLAPKDIPTKWLEYISNV